jgi:hypothetical protein
MEDLIVLQRALAPDGSSGREAFHALIGHLVAHVDDAPDAKCPRCRVLREVYRLDVLDRGAAGRTNPYRGDTMTTEGLTTPASIPAPVLIADLRRQLTDYEDEDETSMTAESIGSVLDAFASTHAALELAAADAGHDVGHYLGAAAARL